MKACSGRETELRRDDGVMASFQVGGPNAKSPGSRKGYVSLMVSTVEVATGAEHPGHSANLFLVQTGRIRQREAS